MRNAKMPSGWAGETTLDVEMAHAIAPGARIVLALTGVDEVEGTSGFAEIMTAERYLVDVAHVSVISQSFAATEETFPSVASLMALRGVYELAERRGVSVVSASGDGGATSNRLNPLKYDVRRVVSWPASDPLVTAVGGTQVSLDTAGADVDPPAGWSGSGGGLSSVFSRPSWQSGVAAVVGNHRGVPDIAMIASCAPGIEIVRDASRHGRLATSPRAAGRARRRRCSPASWRWPISSPATISGS